MIKMLLKNEHLLESFGLVKELDNQTAQAIRGGVRIKNETGSQQTVYWIRPLSGEAGVIAIPNGRWGSVNKNDVTIIYDELPYRSDVRLAFAPDVYDRGDEIALQLADFNPDLVELVPY